MAGVVVPVVVDSVEKSVGLDLGSTTRGLVDVVVLEGNFISGTIEIKGPVLVSIAGGGVVARAIDVRVRDCDISARIGAEDDVLSGDVGGLRGCQSRHSRFSWIEDKGGCCSDHRILHQNSPEHAQIRLPASYQESLTVTWSIQTLSVPEERRALV